MWQISPQAVASKALKNSHGKMFPKCLLLFSFLYNYRGGCRGKKKKAKVGDRKKAKVREKYHLRQLCQNQYTLLQAPPQV